MKKLITVLDLGSNKIAAALAEASKDGSASLLALENLNSRGIEGAEVTDVGKAVEDVSSLMRKLQRIGKKKIRNVFVTGRGADILLSISRGMIPLSKTPREITKKDVKRCLDIAAMIKLPLDRAIVQKIVRSFYIDGGPFCVGNPIGLYGIKLEVEMFVATANQSKIENITKIIDHAGLLLDGIYLSSMTCADSVLEEKEKEKGVLLLDMGDAVTDALIFKDNMLKSFNTVAKGAKYLLRGSMAVDGKRLDLLLTEILAALAPGKWDISSAVVAGGGALLDGVIEETEKILKVPARIGIVKNAGFNLNSQDVAIHTSTIGLINKLREEYRVYHTQESLLQKTFRKAIEIYESYF